MSTYSVDVDLELGCPQTKILERISRGTHLPSPEGWQAELTAGYGKQF